MHKEKIKVVIVDDHKLIRKNLRKMIEAEDSYTVIADFSEPEAAIDLLKRGTQVDVFLIDWELYDKGSSLNSSKLMSGLELGKKILQEYNWTQIILITGVEYDKVGAIIHDSFKAGIQGFLLKECEEKDVFAALDEVSRGSFYYRDKVMDLLARHKNMIRDKNFLDPVQLSPEELRVLSYAADGKSNALIAQIEACGASTIDGRNARIKEKLQAENLCHAISIAYKRGILSIYD